MEQTIARAKSCTVDCRNVDRKLRQILDMSEDEAHFHMKQSAFLYNLGAQTLPKSHHCLSMRLTLEYFTSSSLGSNDSSARKFSAAHGRHYVILSKNILAASVVINSTVNSSKVCGWFLFFTVFSFCIIFEVGVAYIHVGLFAGPKKNHFSYLN